MVDPQSFRDAMARLGAAVSVVTTAGPAGQHGFTATAVCSVTDAPPTLLVCMNRDGTGHTAFRENAVLCVNVLTAGQQALSPLFAGFTDLAMDGRFAAVEWDQAATGSPVLPGAAASFDCRIVQVAEVGSHSVFFCEVDAIRSGPEQDGLIYYARAYHRVGGAS